MSTVGIIVIAIITFIHKNLILLTKHLILPNYKSPINYRKKTAIINVLHATFYSYFHYTFRILSHRKQHVIILIVRHIFFYSHLFIILRSRSYYLCLFERVRNINCEPKIDIRQLERIGRNSDFIYTYNFSP